MYDPLCDLTPEERIRYAQAYEEATKSIEPILEALEDARRITSKDLSVTVTNNERQQNILINH